MERFNIENLLKTYCEYLHFCEFLINDNTIFFDADSGYYRKLEVIPEPIPEPSTLLMVLIGGAGLMLYKRWRNELNKKQR